MFHVTFVLLLQYMHTKQQYIMPNDMSHTRVNHSLYTILIADDSNNHLEKLKQTLQKENFNVLTTTNGQQVSTIAKTKSPDLILLSLQNTHETSLATICKLKNEHDTKNIPVIYLTTSTHQEDFKHVAHYDEFEFIARPLSKTELIVRMENLLLQTELFHLFNKQNKKYQQLIQNKEKLQAITHDLQTPLNSIKATLRTIHTQKENITNSEIKSLIEKIIETTDESLLLLNHISKWNETQPTSL